MQDAQELLKKALALPDKARAHLAGSLIDSLDDTVDENAEAAWQEEIVRRLEFPFVVVYATLAFHTVVLASAHGHLRPGYWKGRIGHAAVDIRDAPGRWCSLKAWRKGVGAGHAGSEFRRACSR